MTDIEVIGRPWGMPTALDRLDPPTLPIADNAIFGHRWMDGGMRRVKVPGNDFLVEKHPTMMCGNCLLVWFPWEHGSEKGICQWPR